MNDEDRMLSAARGPDDAAEASLRPQTLADFTGQQGSRENLRVFHRRGEKPGRGFGSCVAALGRRGLGKTTLAQIVARELGVGFRATSGPVIQRAGDLAAILTNLQPRDVLFIDEIHRLQPAIEEILYPAMEDFQLDLIIGEGPGARTVRIDLPPFTLVGATTRAGLLATPLRDRFGIPLRLVFYTVEELARIVMRMAEKLAMNLTSRGRRRDRPALPRHPPDRRPADPPDPGFRGDGGGCAHRPGGGRRRADPAGGGRAGAGRDGHALPAPPGRAP